MKHQRLLNKILRYYLICILLTGLVAVSVFYLLMMKNHTREVDEFLLARRNRMVEQSLDTLQISNIPLWNRFSSEATILPERGPTEINRWTTENIFGEYKKRAEPHRLLYSQIKIEGERYILAIRVNIYESQKILQTSAVILALLTLVLMAVLFFITLLIRRNLWKPFYQTLSLTENLDIQRNELPNFPSTNTQEFAQLNSALENLLDNYHQAYKIQREFSENASNEIQAPLSMFHSTLDMLLHLPGMTDEQREFIRTIHDDSSYLTHTSTNLQLLAQLDNQQFPDTQPLNIADMVADSLSFLSKQAEALNISVETYLTDRSLTLNANKKLVESLIHNLTANAIKHNTPNGRILTTLHGNRLDIINTGIEQPLDPAMLFRRFGRMNRAAKGSGLGLAIVHQICTHYGWEIFYGFAGGMHRFAVTFTEGATEHQKADRLLT